MNHDFPKASDNDEAVVVSGRVWNRVVEVLNYAQGLHVSAPLQMMETPGGPVIALRQAASSPVKLLRVTGNETGGGKYTAVILDAPASDVAATGDLSAADMGVAGETVRFCNGYEVGASTHDLSSSVKSVEIPAVYRRTNSDGVKVYASALVQTEDCEAGAGGGGGGDVDGGTF